MRVKDKNMKKVKSHRKRCRKTQVLSWGGKSFPYPPTHKANLGNIKMKKVKI
jgi:hypothetical protein